MKFQANSVEYWSRDEVKTVFFGNEEKELALLMSNVPGTPDHYLEWNDQSNACINAVKEIQLSPQELRVHLLPEVAKRLRVSDLVIVFTIAEYDFKEISQYLSTIFGEQLIIKKTMFKRKHHQSKTIAV